MKYIILFLILMASTNTAYSSCLGMKGEMLKRCQCFKSLKRPILEEQKCQQPSECVVLHDKCGGWASFNKKYVVEYKKLYTDPYFKSQMPKPNVTCHQNMCRLRPKVSTRSGQR